MRYAVCSRTQARAIGAPIGCVTFKVVINFVKVRLRPFADLPHSDKEQQTVTDTRIPGFRLLNCLLHPDKEGELEEKKESGQRGKERESQTDRTREGKQCRKGSEKEEGGGKR